MRAESLLAMFTVFKYCFSKLLFINLLVTFLYDLFNIFHIMLLKNNDQNIKFHQVVVER